MRGVHSDSGTISVNQTIVASPTRQNFVAAISVDNVVLHIAGANYVDRADQVPVINHAAH